MEPVTVVIPANYTEAGKILGMFELRNLIEAAVFTLPVLMICIMILPFALTVNITIMMILCVPLAGFSLMGIRGYSLLTFLRIYFKWRKYKRLINPKIKKRREKLFCKRNKKSSVKNRKKN